MNAARIQEKLPPLSTILIYAAVVYIIGIAGLIIEGTRPLFIFLVPVNILLSIFLVLIHEPALNKRLLVAASIVFAGGFLVEWIGVKTGWIFGDYTYKFGLGPHIWDVPPIMGVNWFLLVYGTSIISLRFTQKTWLNAGIAASLMVFYDLFLEPAAIRYSFWKWGPDYIPLQNYLAWWVLGFVFCWIFIKITRPKQRNIMAEAMFYMQLLFFIILWIFNNLEA